MSKKNPIQDINARIEKLLKEKEEFLEKQERKIVKVLRKSWGEEMVSDPLINVVIESVKDMALLKFEELKKVEAANENLHEQQS